MFKELINTKIIYGLVAIIKAIMSYHSIKLYWGLNFLVQVQPQVRPEHFMSLSFHNISCHWDACSNHSAISLWGVRIKHRKVVNMSQSVSDKLWVLERLDKNIKCPLMACREHAWVHYASGFTSSNGSTLSTQLIKVFVSVVQNIIQPFSDIIERTTTISLKGYIFYLRGVRVWLQWDHTNDIGLHSFQAEFFFLSLLQPIVPLLHLNNIGQLHQFGQQ